MLALARHQTRRVTSTTQRKQWQIYQYRYISTKNNDATKDALRRLLRETAQPVAVVTSYYPFDGQQENENEKGHKFHGATLSSFTSIALDPHPLVAFSLRIPSRMATSLKERIAQSEHNNNPNFDFSSRENQKREPERIQGRGLSPNLVINLLSSTQSTTSHHFARADLFPDPFRITPHELTAEGLPVLTGSLGALSCELVTCMPLHNLLDDGRGVDAEVDTTNAKEGSVISELFISRVVRVESVGTLPLGSGSLPLLYHRRKYATAHPL